MNITSAKIDANRRNAAMSTGPTSAEGKSRSAANSTKSGWFTRELQIRPQDQERYAAFRQTWLDSISPDGALESELFEDFLRATWRKQQVIDAQNFITESADPLIFLDTTAQSNLDRLLRYEAQFERRAQRTLAELRRLQTARAMLTTEDSSPAAAAAPLANPASVASQKRTQIAASREAAISPELHRTLAVFSAESQLLTARARAFAAGLPLDQFASADKHQQQQQQ